MAKTEYEFLKNLEYELWSTRTLSHNYSSYERGLDDALFLIKERLGQVIVPEEKTSETFGNNSIDHVTV